MKAKSNNKTKAIEIANIKEDLMEHEANHRTLDLNQAVIKSIQPIHRLLKKEVAACAQKIAIDAEELQAWIDCQIAVPEKTLLCLLRISNQYVLDPLKEETVLTQYQKGWQASISIDGWIKILHQHPALTGITFTQSPEFQNLSDSWIECTIHRSDRVIPTTIREYLSEVQNESELWKKMPRRMLRHRALQQCARISLGLPLGKISDPSEEIHENTSQDKKIINATSTKNIHTSCHASKLKHFLENPTKISTKFIMRK